MPALSRRGAAKRTTDILVGSLLLVIAAPIIMIAAAAVRIESSGPSFFRQTRVGRGRRPFTLLKLRTMRHGANAGALVTGKGDARVTFVGTLLRRLKIDELPQLVNVVFGEMSLVGPRPEDPRFVAGYERSWDMLLEVRPGLTDEASLAFRREEELLGFNEPDESYRAIVLPAKARISMGALRKGSTGSDLKMIARTVFAVIGMNREREHPEVTSVRAQLSALHEQASSR